MRGIL